jgi:hypothetical protein
MSDAEFHRSTWAHHMDTVGQRHSERILGYAVASGTVQLSHNATSRRRRCATSNYRQRAFAPTLAQRSSRLAGQQQSFD